MPRSIRTIALALIMGCMTVALTACTQVEESESTYSPSSVAPVNGKTDILQVTLNVQAARRADIQTATVRPRGRHTSIPYAALIYSEGGETYTYVTREPLVYMREVVDVDHITGEHVILRHGPSVGTSVVTTGAAEVYGAESGVEE